MKEKIDKILKQFPTLKKASDLKPIEYIPTPFPPLNALTSGGFPRGRYTTIAGPSGVGKTLVVLQTIAYNQAINPNFVAAIADVECSLDKNWLAKLGIDLDRLYVIQFSEEEKKKVKKKKGDAEEDSSAPTNEELLESTAHHEYALTMEWYTDRIIEYTKTGAIDLILVDSVGAFLTKSEKNKTMEENTMLTLQRKLGEFFRRNVHDCSLSGTAIVFIGHVYNVPTTTGVTLEEVRGGHAFKYYPSLRLIQRRGSPKVEGTPTSKIMCPDGKEREIFYGWPCRIKLEKTKVNPNESQEIVIPFVPNKGLDSERTTILSAFAYGLLDMAGAWISSEFILNENGEPGGKLQGKDNCVAYFQNNPEQKQKLFKALDNIQKQEWLSQVTNSDITEIIKNTDNNLELTEVI